MEANLQVSEPVAATPQDAPLPTPTNDALPTDLQKYVAEPATVDATAQQAPPQAQVPPTSQPMQSVEDKRIADFQRELNQRQIALYQAQQEIERLRQSQSIPQQQNQRNQNPHDPNQDWASWLRWENQQAAEMAAQRTREEIMGLAREQARIQQETQWAMAHPNVDINQVKAFASMRGVTNLDDAYTLMTYPTQMASVQQQATMQTIQNYQRPQTMATPVRGGQSAGTVSLSYEKLAADFQNTNGLAYNSWPKELQNAFDRETFQRQEVASRRG